MPLRPARQAALQWCSADADAACIVSKAALPVRCGSLARGGLPDPLGNETVTIVLASGAAPGWRLVPE